MQNLIYTKVIIPDPPANYLDRSLLNKKLDGSQKHKIPLTLVSASAGSGKTSLLSAWAKKSKQKITWLSIDKEDSDPRRFWSYFCFSIRQQYALFADDFFESIITAKIENIDRVVEQVINSIFKFNEDITIIIDDYHSINSDLIHKSIYKFVKYLPNNCNLILSSRFDPPIPLSGLLISGKMVEIRAKNLNFTPEESKRLLQKNFNITFNKDEITQLDTLTEGWIAGLQMVALAISSNQNRSDYKDYLKETPQILSDYMLENFLHSIDDEIKQFLLSTSILEILNPEICDAVVQKNISKKTIDYMVTQNYFISVIDETANQYKYHHLFRDFLYSQLKISKNISEIKELYSRGVKWYQSKGYQAQAIDLASESDDPEILAVVLEKYILKLFYSNQHHQINILLNKIPDNTKKQHPLIAAVYAGCTMLNEGDFELNSEIEEKIEEWLSISDSTRIAKVSNNINLTKEDETAEFFAEKIRCYMGFHYRLPPNENIKKAKILLEKIPKKQRWFKSALYHNLGINYMNIGDYHNSRENFKSAIARGKLCGDSYNIASSYSFLSRIERKHGKLFSSENLCIEGIKTVKSIAGKNIPYCGILHINLGIIYTHQARFKQAIESLKKGLDLLRFMGNDYYVELALIHLAIIYSLLGQTMKEQEILGRISSNIKQFLPEYIEYELSKLIFNNKIIEEAKFWYESNIEENIKNSDTDKMEPLFAIRNLLDLQFNNSNIYPIDYEKIVLFLNNYFKKDSPLVPEQIIIHKLLAKCSLLQGKNINGLEHITKALRLAMQDSLKLDFLLEIKQLKSLLNECCNNEVKEFIKNIYDSCTTEDQIIEEPNFIKELSKREYVVLQAIINGLSNQEISDNYYISMSTVKTHVNRIFSKLNVKNRSQAILKVIPYIPKN